MNITDVYAHFAGKFTELSNLQSEFIHSQEHYAPIFDSLSDIPCRFDFDHYGLSMYLSGDTERLERCMNALVAAGFVNSIRDTSHSFSSELTYNTFYHKPNSDDSGYLARIWFSFTIEKTVEEPDLASQTDDQIPA